MRKTRFATRKPRHELFFFRDRRIFLSRRRTQSSIKRTAKKRFLHKRDSEKWGRGSVWKAVSHACHAGNDLPAPPRSRFPNLRLLEKREPLRASRDVRQYPEPASRARPYFNQHRRVASRVPRSTASRELTSGLGCIPSAHARLGETRGALEAGARDRGPAKFAAKR